METRKIKPMEHTNKEQNLINFEKEREINAIKRFKEKIKEHHKQNTYEGDEALLYHTTIDEIINLSKE